MIDLYEKGRKKFDWWMDWRGDCVAVVAGGPSLKNQDLSILRDRIHVVVVNESYRLCPWAEILYSCDSTWWRLREHDLKKFGGLKISFENADVQLDLKKIQIKKEKGDKWSNEMLFSEPGVVGSGGNSGFQLTNIVAQKGATGIALLGVDMRADGGLHWHGRHPNQLRNPHEVQLEEWRKIFDKAAFRLKDKGVDVVNCSSTSALENYPKMTINDMLERWGL